MLVCDTQCSRRVEMLEQRVVALLGRRNESIVLSCTCCGGVQCDSVGSYCEIGNGDW